jgi:hypothetical protein
MMQIIKHGRCNIASSNQVNVNAATSQTGDNNG